MRSWREDFASHLAIGACMSRSNSARVILRCSRSSAEGSWSSGTVRAAAYLWAISTEPGTYCSRRRGHSRPDWACAPAADEKEHDDPDQLFEIEAHGVSLAKRTVRGRIRANGAGISGDGQANRQFLAVRMRMLKHFLSGCLDSHGIRKREPVEKRPHGSRSAGARAFSSSAVRVETNRMSIKTPSQRIITKVQFAFPSRHSEHGYDIAVTSRE